MRRAFGRAWCQQIHWLSVLFLRLEGGGGEGASGTGSRSTAQGAHSCQVGDQGGPLPNEPGSEGKRCGWGPVLVKVWGGAGPGGDSLSHFWWQALRHTEHALPGNEQQKKREGQSNRDLWLERWATWLHSSSVATSCVPLSS